MSENFYEVSDESVEKLSINSNSWKSKEVVIQIDGNNTQQLNKSKPKEEEILNPTKLPQNISQISNIPNENHINTKVNLANAKSTSNEINIVSEKDSSLIKNSQDINSDELSSIYQHAKTLKTPSGLPLLIAAIMVKDEEPRLERTMKSVLPAVDGYVILDTGSKDKTMEVAKEFCKKNNKQLHLYEEPFINFGESRNALLARCQGKSEFILLMDANDEGRNPEILVLFLQNILSKSNEEEYKRRCVFSVRFKLDNDVNMGATANFSRIAIIRNNMGKEIFFEMPVHETINTKKPAYYINDASLVFTEPTFSMYQDRALDKPSDKRYERDIKMLEEYAEKIGGYNPRILHYLCQTINNMKNYDKLYDYADKLIKFDKEEDAYSEYLFFGYLHHGTAGKKTGKDTKWKTSLLNAYKYSMKGASPRCESLYILAVFELGDFLKYKDGVITEYIENLIKYLSMSTNNPAEKFKEFLDRESSKSKNKDYIVHLIRSLNLQKEQQEKIKDYLKMQIVEMSEEPFKKYVEFLGSVISENFAIPKDKIKEVLEDGEKIYKEEHPSIKYKILLDLCKTNNITNLPSIEIKTELLDAAYEYIIKCCKVLNPKQEILLTSQIDMNIYTKHRQRLREVIEQLRNTDPKDMPNIKIQN
jgi:hypothetical protein